MSDPVSPEELARAREWREKFYQMPNWAGKTGPELLALYAREERKRIADQKVETGWLIEKTVDGRPQWLTCAWSFGWTDDSLNAIRFVRREDAEQIGSMVETVDIRIDIRITEHQWG